MKAGPLAEVAKGYTHRMTIAPTMKDVTVKKNLAPCALRTAEATLIQKHLTPSYALIALDKGGIQITSEAFAQKLSFFQESKGGIDIIIGGAEGLCDTLLKKAHLTIAFGHVVWPHQLVRIMLLEQVYRAQTLLAGHPYHRP
jgi:23S rRNA (pseudouridine1915-N3)-methyltransferase